MHQTRTHHFQVIPQFRSSTGTLGVYQKSNKIEYDTTGTAAADSSGRIPLVHVANLVPVKWMIAVPQTKIIQRCNTLPRVLTVIQQCEKRPQEQEPRPEAIPDKRYQIASLQLKHNNGHINRSSEVLVNPAHQKQQMDEIVPTPRQDCSKMTEEQRPNNDMPLSQKKYQVLGARDKNVTPIKNLKFEIAPLIQSVKKHTPDCAEHLLSQISRPVCPDPKELSAPREKQQSFSEQTYQVRNTEIDPQTQPDNQSLSHRQHQQSAFNPHPPIGDVPSSSLHSDAWDIDQDRIITDQQIDNATNYIINNNNNTIEQQILQKQFHQSIKQNDCNPLFMSCEFLDRMHKEISVMQSVIDQSNIPLTSRQCQKRQQVVKGNQQDESQKCQTRSKRCFDPNPSTVLQQMHQSYMNAEPRKIMDKSNIDLEYLEREVEEYYSLLSDLELTSAPLLQRRCSIRLSNPKERKQVVSTELLQENHLPNEASARERNITSSKASNVVLKSIHECYYPVSPWVTPIQSTPTAQSSSSSQTSVTPVATTTTTATQQFQQESFSDQARQNIIAIQELSPTHEDEFISDSKKNSKECLKISNVCTISQPRYSKELFTKQLESMRSVLQTVATPKSTSSTSILAKQKQAQTTSYFHSSSSIIPQTRKSEQKQKENNSQNRLDIALRWHFQKKRKPNPELDRIKAVLLTNWTNAQAFASSHPQTEQRSLSQLGLFSRSLLFSSNYRFK